MNSPRTAPRKLREATVVHVRRVLTRFILQIALGDLHRVILRVVGILGKPTAEAPR